MGSSRVGKERADGVVDSSGRGFIGLDGMGWSWERSWDETGSWEFGT